jgi:hypothetical protein
MNNLNAFKKRRMIHPVLTENIVANPCFAHGLLKNKKRIRWLNKRQARQQYDKNKT